MKKKDLEKLSDDELVRRALAEMPGRDAPDLSIPTAYGPWLVTREEELIHIQQLVAKGCVPSDALVAYAGDGTFGDKIFSPEVVGKIRLHLDVCAECAEYVAVLRADMEEGG